MVFIDGLDKFVGKEVPFGIVHAISDTLLQIHLLVSPGFTFSFAVAQTRLSHAYFDSRPSRRSVDVELE